MLVSLFVSLFIYLFICLTNNGSFCGSWLQCMFPGETFNWHSGLTLYGGPLGFKIVFSLISYFFKELYLVVFLNVVDLRLNVFVIMPDGSVIMGVNICPNVSALSVSHFQ